jgi:hypothetical protein
MTAGSDHVVIDVQRPAAIARHAAKTLLTASVIPTGLFYTALSTLGLHAAVLSAIGWYYALLLVRLVRRRPIVGAALLGTGLITARAVVVFWTGSAYLYFLQPIAGTVATATAIAVTALAGRPLLERLARDFVPLPDPLVQRLRAARFFGTASLLWAVTYAVNAVGTVWLLSTSPLGMFLLLKSLLGPALTLCATATTYLLLRRLLHRDGISLRWQSPAIASEPAPVAA